MITKEKLLETIKAMPEDKFEDIDELIENIHLMEKIKRAEDDIANGRVFTHQQVKDEMEKWKSLHK